MNKLKKTTGKELAKLNIRKKFYSKLERKYSLLQGKQDVTLFLSMNKNTSFPESDDISLYLKEVSTEQEIEMDIEKKNTIDITYLEEVEFLKRAAESELITVYRQITDVDSNGDLLRGENSTSNDNYQYLEVYNWVISLTKSDELSELIADELENPTEYDLSPKIAEVQEPVYYKNKSYRRRRRRK